MGAMAAFAVNDMLMKLTAQRYPLGEVITVRGTDRDRAGRHASSIGLGHVRRAALRVQPDRARPHRARRRRDGAVHHRADPHAARGTLRDQSRLAADHHGARGDLLRRRGRLAALDRDHRRLHRHAAHRQADAGRFNAWALLGIASAFAARGRDVDHAPARPAAFRAS